MVAVNTAAQHSDKPLDLEDITAGPTTTIVTTVKTPAASRSAPHLSLTSMHALPEHKHHNVSGKAEGHTSVLAEKAAQHGSQGKSTHRHHQTSNQTSNQSRNRASSMTAVDRLHHLITRIGGRVKDTAPFQQFANTSDKDLAAGLQNKIVRQLRDIAAAGDGWLRLAPPDKGPLLSNMIRSDPWNCDLLPAGDGRSWTCRLAPDDEHLNPKLLNCGFECNIEHANAFRTEWNLGAMPCCTTPPFCAAPLCSEVEKKETTCTKRKPEDDVAYMKLPESWPAYHGWGGSFELDALKLLDAVACHGSDCPDKTFDLVVDLGANTGYYTEKFTVRNFAKNYVLIDANPTWTDVLINRWGDENWRDSWFTQQVPQKEGAPFPAFEIITQPLGNQTGRMVDICSTEDSMEKSAGCKVAVKTVSDLIPGALSPAFQDIFKQAQSAFVKVDTEGMDELVMRGMKRLLEETRGQYEDQKPRYLINFLQFEFSPVLMKIAGEREGFNPDAYNIKTAVEFLESIGFESFLMGPRYLPLSHGSWRDDYKTWIDDPNNNAGTRLNYPSFDDRVCTWCQNMDKPSFTADVVAIRSSHPRAAEVKLALGACQESKDFDMSDPQYSFA